MNKHRIHIALLSLVLLFSGCYFEADETYRPPSAETEDASGASGEEEQPYEEPGSADLQDNPSEAETGDGPRSPDEFVLQYVPRIYEMGEEYSFYHVMEDEAWDVKYRVLEAHIDDGGELEEAFSFLSEEDKDNLACHSEDVRIYYTVELTGGERMTEDSVNVGGVRPLFVKTDRGEYKKDDTPLSERRISPCPDYESTHGGYEIPLRAGEVQTVTFVTRIEKNMLEEDLYLEIDPFGQALFDNTLDPDLTKTMTEVGVVRLRIDAEETENAEE